MKHYKTMLFAPLLIYQYYLIFLELPVRVISEVTFNTQSQRYEFIDTSGA